MAPPNVLYVHSHDTGRYVQPYGYAVPTPNIQHLADQGALFRQAFCAAPVCSGSRAALLTGQCTHATGMLGLAHRGYRLTHPERHLAHVLRSAGYWSGLIGEQHVSADPKDLGYDHVVDLDSTKVRDVAPAASRLIAARARAGQPFFLSIGFFETHREYFEPSSVPDALYSRPPENIVDTAMTRRDMASFKASARSLDQGVGTVLNALEENGLVDNALVILTTDHGLAFPDPIRVGPGRPARRVPLRPLARSRRGHQPDRRSDSDRRPLRPERTAAQLDGPDRRPVTRRSGRRGRGHLLQHGGSAVSDRPHHGVDPGRPHPDPARPMMVAASGPPRVVSRGTGRGEVRRVLVPYTGGRPATNPSN
jgi:arylsulfatase A-like enzyme